jgi:hypothetical protein
MMSAMVYNCSEVAAAEYSMRRVEERHEKRRTRAMINKYLGISSQFDTCR